MRTPDKAALGVALQPELRPEQEAGGGAGHRAGQRSGALRGLGAQRRTGRYVGLRSRGLACAVSLVALATGLLAGAAQGVAYAADVAPSVYAPISPQRMSDAMKVLGSDAFEGRAPGSAGEARTVAWLIAQYKQIGLEPGGENGGWTQRVPLQHTRVGKATRLQVAYATDTLPLEQVKDVYFTTARGADHLEIQNAPLVFVGYGVHAPERGWDDFKGVDLKGKIAVFLINDPDFDAKPGEPVAGKFGGRAMTYYGRWTYKYEEATRRGAIGALIVHDTPGAAYGWSTVIAPGGEAFDFEQSGQNQSLLMQGWISTPAATQVFAKAGLDLPALRVQARQASFQPVTLPHAAFSLAVPVEVTHLESQNVLGKLTGSKRPDETVMFGAHWDAFGMSKDAQGHEVIRHGAIDDGSGVAGVLEIARAFKAGPKPERTVMFASWTAEERGLLGSGWYAAHPLAPLEKTAANFTMDVLQMAGPSRTAYMVGAGQDTVQDDVVAAAERQGRVMLPEAMSERGAFYRADHLPFARAGVPVVALMDMAGYPDLLKGGVPAGRKWLQDYMVCYHQACDAWSLDWDVRGAAEDVALLYNVGRTLAFSQAWPQWKPGSEFAAVRAQSAAVRGGH
ncbi:M28 family metallopeptidase [Acetobacter farinalis]|uniref:M28 family metallopeptidase n=1 Tax=Acetobacter farinalis TaxID=1260984 RepID=A0ABT3Q3R2_9PROT|nr:M28 family metallopeptidase [Acetobacter farinalis]MCX2559918.1 M28 family metallopeptidase [Acetobacter farinalis]NHO28579.1 M20/M25/M40 family metallo-hydrolase [Acetobacter farinalis]